MGPRSEAGAAANRGAAGILLGGRGPGACHAGGGGPVGFFGPMCLFGIDTREARVLTRINRGMNLLRKLLLLAWTLEKSSCPP